MAPRSAGSPGSRSASTASDHEHESDVGAEHAVAESRSLRARGDARSDHHREDWAEPEHDQRVTEQPIGQPPTPRPGRVLDEGEGGDVPHARRSRSPDVA